MLTPKNSLLEIKSFISWPKCPDAILTRLLKISVLVDMVKDGADKTPRNNNLLLSKFKLHFFCLLK